MNSTFIIKELILTISDKNLIMTTWGVIIIYIAVVNSARATTSVKFVQKRDLFETFDDNTEHQSRC